MKGFTLIELLVVVLIVGILSAIALPQYELVVEKSRATEAMVNVKAIQDAIQRLEMRDPGAVHNAVTNDQIADVQLKGGSWVNNTTFVTSNFVYATSGSNLYLERRDGGQNGTLLYSITFPQIPGEFTPYCSGNDGFDCDNTDYDQVIKLFTSM